MQNSRSITVPAGIGDFIWLAMKLVNSKERFHIRLPDGQPQRGHQILQLLPQLVVSHEYVSGLNYTKISKENAWNKNQKWKDFSKQSFTLSANTWLEQGHRIERFIADLDTSFNLRYATTDEDKATAQSILSGKHQFIGIYGSAYSNARNWNMWGNDEWFQLVRMMYTKNKNLKFVIIGAQYDTDLAQLLIKQLSDSDIPCVDTIGQPLSVVVEILKRLSYFIGFPSGLSILNETLGKDGCMFYPDHLKMMINTWAHPQRIQNGNYKGCQKCSPVQLFDWLQCSYKLFEKLSA